jgi:hypothetical protein
MLVCPFPAEGKQAKVRKKKVRQPEILLKNQGVFYPAKAFIFCLIVASW